MYNYEYIHDEIIKILQDFEKGKENDKLTRFSLMLFGNINIRLNTIFFLLHNEKSDGVFALIRTLYEINISFRAYINSDTKEDFINLYNSKKGFESSKKIMRLLQNKDYELVTDDDKSKVSEQHDYFKNEIKGGGSKLRDTKTWYEIATNKSLYDLSKDFDEEEAYFYCYDLTSNWVHPQQLDKSISNYYGQHIDKYNFSLLINALILSLNSFINNFILLIRYLEIEKIDSIQIISNELENLYKRLCIDFNKLNSTATD